jgi:pimeloyl-ACP methyl ester carboxylesterase
LSILAAHAAIGCTSSEPAATPSRTGDTDWAACPSGFRDECRSLMMPLDRSTPDGVKIPVFVSHAKSFGAHRADLWLVQGGPGDSASYFDTFVDELRARLPGFDIYTIEHRGVGESARLGCPEQESPSSDEGTTISLTEVPACVAAVQAEYNGGLESFRLTPAAQDLADAIDRTRTPGSDVFIYGVSYGTSVAIRYLQLRPDDARGVILDSVSPPGLKFFSDYEKQYDGVLEKLAALCAKDPTCSAHLGSDPWATLSTITQDVAAGACPDAKLTRLVLSRYVDLLLESDSERVAALALLNRVHRCDPPDVAAIAAFRNAMAGASSSSPGAYSQVLQWNVMFSDRWETPAPSLDELSSRCNALALCGEYSLDLGRVRAEWPTFAPDPLNDHWPTTTSSAVLVLNGELDPQTPIEITRDFTEKFSSPQTTFVSFPFSAHDTVVQALGASADDVPCGYQVMLSFLDNPQAPDTTCVANSPPVSFESREEQAQAWFGTRDLWDNLPPDDGGTAEGGPPRDGGVVRESGTADGGGDAGVADRAVADTVGGEPRQEDGEIESGLSRD